MKEFLESTRLISREEFAFNFGCIHNDVVNMCDNDNIRRIIHETRQKMEAKTVLADGTPRFFSTEFGQVSEELTQGQVAAIDGTFLLPHQVYSGGQALCIGVGSLSYTRPLTDRIYYWSNHSQTILAQEPDDFVVAQEKSLYDLSVSAYLRYFEIKHGLEIEEPYIFFDGTLVYEWLVSTIEGVQLYDQLFNSGKSCIGIIKDIKQNIVFSVYARALRIGEVFIVETLYDHLNKSASINKNRGESSKQALPDFLQNEAKNILRGIFKPKHKVFGFEVHRKDLRKMLHLAFADCQMNNNGHEIPYLLNLVDMKIKANCSQSFLKNAIKRKIYDLGEDIFFEEMDEQEMRVLY